MNINLPLVPNLSFITLPVGMELLKRATIAIDNHMLDKSEAHAQMQNNNLYRGVFVLKKVQRTPPKPPRIYELSHQY